MMPAAFRLLIDNHRQLAIARDVRQEVEGRIFAVSHNQLLSEDGNVVAARNMHASFYPRSLAWIISARRMLSAIFECTAGDGLISSRFNRTAAMSDAAMSKTALGFCSSLAGLPRS